MSTSATQTRVTVIHDQPAQFRERLAERFPDVRFSYAGAPDEVAPVLEAEQPEVVFSIKQPNFPGHAHRPALACPSVRWIQVGGSGYEQFVPWDGNRITLTNCAGVLARYLAETVTGAILMLNGSFLTYRAQQLERRWVQHGFAPLSGQTLLVVGAGQIGGCVADNAKALGMRVLGIRAHSDVAHPSVDEMHPPGSFMQLLGRADVLSLHVRVGEATTGLMDAAAFAAMKPGAMFINTSRGAVVEEEALVDALCSGRLRAAYLDVFQTEPLPADSPLWSLENLFMTPHTSDSVHDWPVHFAEFFADNLERWRSGEPLINVVRGHI